MKFTDLFTHSITERDGESVDFARLVTFIACAIFFTLSIYDTYKNGKFDYIQFSAGFAAIVAAGATAVKIKLDTEPQVTNDRE